MVSFRCKSSKFQGFHNFADESETPNEDGLTLTVVSKCEWCSEQRTQSRKLTKVVETTPLSNTEEPFQFINNAPDDKEWTAHVELLNEWTPTDIQLRHIVGYIQSGPHYPKHMHQDLIEQYMRLYADTLATERAIKALTQFAPPIEERRRADSFHGSIYVTKTGHIDAAIATLISTLNVNKKENS